MRRLLGICILTFSVSLSVNALDLKSAAEKAIVSFGEMGKVMLLCKDIAYTASVEKTKVKYVYLKKVVAFSKPKVNTFEVKGLAPYRARSYIYVKVSRYKNYGWRGNERIQVQNTAQPLRLEAKQEQFEFWLGDEV